MSEYKVGVEVKTIFKNDQIDLLCPNPGAEALEERRVCEIYQQECSKKLPVVILLKRTEKT